MFLIFHILHSRLAKQKVLQSDFEAEVTSYKSQVDTLKSKNNVSIKILPLFQSSNHSRLKKVLKVHFLALGEFLHFQDLRGKNRKAIEALNDLEQKYVKVLKEKS